MTASERKIAVAAAFALALGACATTQPGGIHARMAFSEEGGLRVIDVPAEGPAAKAGLQPGDRIVSIDEVPVRTLSMKAVVEKLRGRAGTKAVVEVQREDEILELEIERAPYQ